MLPWLWRQVDQRARQPVLPESPARGNDVTPEDVYRDAAARFLDVQVTTDDILDNKTFNAFSVGSTVLPLTFGLLGLGTTDTSALAISLLGLALAAYLALLLLAWRASAIRGLEYRPDIATLRRHSADYPGDTLQRWVANEYADSIAANKMVLERKARWVGGATTALYVEGFFLSLAAIATLLL